MMWTDTTHSKNSHPRLHDLSGKRWLVITLREGHP